MILDFFRKTEKAVDPLTAEENMYLRDFCLGEAIPEVRAGGSLRYLEDLQYSFLLPGDTAKEVQKQAAECFVRVFTENRGRQLIRIISNAGSCLHSINYGIFMGGKTRYYNGFRHSRADFANLSDEEYTAMLMMGTLNDNGYYRQMCLEELERSWTPLRSRVLGMDITPLIFDLVRVNDWAGPLSDLAEQAFMRSLESADISNLLLAFVYADRMVSTYSRSCNRIAVLKDLMAGRIKSISCEETCTAVLCFDESFRCQVCRVAGNNGLFNEAHYRRLFAEEKSGSCARLLFSGLAASGAMDDGELKSCLSAKSSDIRYLAALTLYERHKVPFDGAEKMLLDPSPKVRDLIRFVLRNSGVDAAGLYRDNLAACALCVSENEADGVPDQTAAANRKKLRTAITCISEAPEDDARALTEPFVSHSDPSVRASAIEALARIAAEDCRDVFFGVLTGEEYGPAAAAAYRAIKKNRIYYQCEALYEGYLRNRGSETGTRLLELLTASPFKDRIPYLLRLYGSFGSGPDADEADRRIAQSCLSQAYTAIPEDLKKEILEALELRKEELPEKLVFALKSDMKYF